MATCTLRCLAGRPVTLPPAVQEVLHHVPNNIEYLFFSAAALQRGLGRLTGGGASRILRSCRPGLSLALSRILDATTATALPDEARSRELAMGGGQRVDLSSAPIAALPSLSSSSSFRHGQEK